MESDGLAEVDGEYEGLVDVEGTEDGSVVGSLLTDGE